MSNRQERRTFSDMETVLTLLSLGSFFVLMLTWIGLPHSTVEQASESTLELIGAPQQSRAVGAGAFRATEAALGVAAAELYAALPNAYREQLDELPAIVASLEARAAEARAEMEVLAALAPSGPEADLLAARRQAAQEHLAESVAGLESIRLDLLRLHAGASDLAPLTTLMEDARRMGEDLNRLAEAQREVEDAAGRPG